MTILDLYLASLSITLTAHEYLILKNNLLALKKAKKNLKFRKNLSMDSKKEQKKVKKELSKNMLIMNLVSLSFSVVPIVNVISIPYFVEKQDAFSGNVYSESNKHFNKINKIEMSKRLKLK